METTTAKTGTRFGDRAFQWLTLLMALSVFVLIVLIGYELAQGSQLALQKFGWHFLVSSNWDPVNEQYGALPFIFGTLVSSVIALFIAVPVSIATAVYLTELAPLWLRQPLIMFIELLAAVPSVILGLWGFYVMVPWLHSHLFPALRLTLGFLPLFQGPDYGPCMLAAGIILAIMIIPIITSVSREILRSVPGLQREAAYALGATRWEVTRIAVLSYAKKGLFGAVILGLGRALGETMAVTMVIGNRPEIAKSLFAPGYTLASVIANEFTEATTDTYLSALFEIGLVLLGVTVLVNALAQLLLKTFAGPGVKPQQ
ncbi:MAG: phosphate ABC transporter permease subunit PstC [Verrucomicrobiota bacterium]|jgi:phosphate transport system permease protein